jgi:3-oxoacyl-[acyl-carrier protein] reductase
MPDQNAADVHATDLKGRVALVTGGSGGIGRAIALALAGDGARVAVHYASSGDAAGAVVDEVVARGGEAWAVRADLAAAPEADALVAAVEQRFGPVDVLVANHGVGRPRASLAEVDADEWDRTMAVNTRAPFLLVRHVLPGMRERRFGRVLFTSSIAGLTGGVVGPDYAASKAALHGLVHYLASRVAADGVTVNALAPALIRDTGMLPGEPEELAARVPVGRLGTPDEVAGIALAVLRTGYVTNQVIPVDGGMYPG